MVFINYCIVVLVRNGNEVEGIQYISTTKYVKRTQGDKLIPRKLLDEHIGDNIYYNIQYVHRERRLASAYYIRRTKFDPLFNSSIDQVYQKDVPSQPKVRYPAMVRYRFQP